MHKSIQAEMIIKGGIVVDGSGGKEFAADVALGAGKIIALGNLDDARCEAVFDARGMRVAPGFIDVHAHDDFACIAEPDQVPKISQGVTTVIVGNCGLSLFPLEFAHDPIEPFNLLGPAAAYRYSRYADYIAAIEAVRPRVNVAALVGHGALRVAAMTNYRRAANGMEIERMRASLDEALRHGVVGMSSGLFYPPAQAAVVSELTPLVRDVAAAGGVYTTHIRDEYDGVAEALQEAFQTASQGGAPLVISHHKCAGVKNWGRSGETLGMIDAARKHQEVCLDCYPYTAGSSVIDPQLADSQVEILINWSAKHPECGGRMLEDIAREMGCDQRAAAERLVPGGASYFQIHEDDMRRILSHPACMIGTDGLPADPRPHPRLWGTFPRVLGRYVRELELLPLATAVHKMTGLAADRFRLADRGRIATGLAADLVVFDPDKVNDRATFHDPRQISDGIACVIVNGEIAWRDGRICGGRHGRFLRRAAS